MKKWFIVLITVIVVAFAIVGCFDTEGDIDNQGSGGRLLLEKAHQEAVAQNLTLVIIML